jgi:glucosamine--fructose-6-phosphate aminotransferase (isomerizing)
MCGITAYLGKKKIIFKYLVETLNVLRSRGYDSAGVCSLTNKINLYKTTQHNLDKLLTEDNQELESYNGIGHTRWATHGSICINNTHPFVCYKNQFILIHNGIIKNCEEIKAFLVHNSVTFQGDTDSEIVCNLISYLYHKSKNKNINEVLKESFSRLKGYWSIAILKVDEPNKMYVSNRETPFLIGYTENAYFISSDFNTFAHKTDKYIELNNNDIHELVYDIKNDKINKEIFANYKEYSIDETVKQNLTPYPYKHWLIKEILEQPKSIKKTLKKNNIFNNTFYNIVDNIKNIVIIGAGTSYHAGMMGEVYIKNETKLNAYCINSSEFEIKDIPKYGNTCFLFISQSGETKDLYDIIVKLKKMNKGYRFISVTNSYNSLIPRNCEFNLYLNLTKEMSVGSTKTFTCSVLMMKIIVSKILRQEKNDIFHLSDSVEKTLQTNEKDVKDLLDFIDDKNIVFLSSSKSNIPIVKEVNLKFQELCYIYSLCSGAKNLKHGPLALITYNTPVFFFAPTKEDYNRIKSVAHEVKSRGGFNILISNNLDYDDNIFSKLLYIQYNKEFSNLMTLYPLQLMVYYLSLKKGFNCDMPRNLAKTVTV